MSGEPVAPPDCVEILPVAPNAGGGAGAGAPGGHGQEGVETPEGMGVRREPSHLAVRYSPAAPPGQAAALPGPGGDGDPPPLCLLYLHGFGSDQAGEKAEFFRLQAGRAGLAFCSFDFEGHGRSGGDMRGLTLSRNLENLHQVADWLAVKGHRRLVLLGSSMGGGTALWYSALHPERVLAGMHLAPALEMGRSLLDWAGPERTRAWQETGTLQFANELVSCELGWQLIEDLRAHPVADLVDRYRTPALLLQGRLDATVPWRSVVDFTTRCAFRDIELHLFADGDHRLTDRKARLWALMLEFLRGRRLAPE
jgi:pimeloyl-ACP methyl ester carboxylesterase